METDKIIKQNKEVYDKIADHFSDTRSFLWEDLAMFRDFVKNGDRVLDIGCGNGRLYQLFGKKSRDNKQETKIFFTGLDISKKLIKLAMGKFPQCDFVVGDMRQLPFEDSSFDVVFNLVAFHHLPDRKSQLQALKEMKRVVKPGARAILLNWNAYSDWVNNKIAQGDFTDMGGGLFRVPWKTPQKKVLGDRIYYGFTLNELQALFSEVGFKLEDQYFLRHGERVGVEKGMNIVSVVKEL